ncbi:hypothetical protein V1506DRAFT_191420, partial [Lipomyces tetrasporus]
MSRHGFQYCIYCLLLIAYCKQLQYAIQYKLTQYCNIAYCICKCVTMAYPGYLTFQTSRAVDFLVHVPALQGCVTRQARVCKLVSFPSSPIFFLLYALRFSSTSNCITTLSIEMASKHLQYTIDDDEETSAFSSLDSERFSRAESPEATSSTTSSTHKLPLR